jgi:hypothetical protein
MMARIARISVALALCVVVGAGATQLMAGKPGGGGGGGGGGGCPKGTFCLCAQIYCPVTCANNCKYPNPCVADCAGATGCTLDGPCGIEP